MGFRATLNSVVWLVTHTASDRNGGGERWVLEKKHIAECKWKVTTQRQYTFTEIDRCQFLYFRDFKYVF